MKILFLLPILFLSACGPSGSNPDPDSADENVTTGSFHCANVKRDVLALSGLSKQEFVVSFVKAIAERTSLCTLKQVTQHLDESLSIQCAEDCITKEKQK